MKRVLRISTLCSLLLFCIHTASFALNIRIIESQSAGHTMDQNWLNVVTSMGHTGSIHPQNFLDNNAFFATSDVLIISSGVIALTPLRVNTIQQFMQSGKPVYLQTEYDCNYTSNQAFAQIVNNLGGTFNWVTTMAGTLAPMNVLGTFANTNLPVSPLGYYWYSCYGNPGCDVFPFLSFNNQYHGFFFCPSNPNYGSIITTSDQDWVQSSTSLALMQNIITHLISPSLCASINPVQVSLGNDTTICPGSTITLNATTPNATYLWSTGSTQPTINVSNAGTYWVQVTANGCTGRDTIVVTFGAPFTVNIGNDTTLCTGSTLTLNATTPNATYAWSTGSTQATITVNNTGTYWVDVTINGCTARDSIVVTYTNPPTIFLGNDTAICNGSTLPLNATTPGATYLWSNGSTQPTITVNTSGNYWVQVSIGACTDRDTIGVTILTPPPLNLGSDITICQGSSTTLNATQPNSTGYLWSTGSTAPQINVNTTGTYWAQVYYGPCTVSDTVTVTVMPQPPGNFLSSQIACTGQTVVLQAPGGYSYQWNTGASTSTISVNASGNYSVVISDGNCSNSDTAIITFAPTPFVELGPPKSICKDSTLLIAPYPTDPSFSYLWNTGQTVPQINIANPGVYILTATNNCGNESDTLVVSRAQCECYVYIPNTFTPNGDGVNEEFKPGYECDIREYEFRIFNRWGEQIFYSAHPSFGWKGNVNDDTDAPMGVYVYYLRYESQQEKNGTREMRGYVNLIR